MCIRDSDHTPPRTATDLLESILARDASSTSATTMRRQADDPAYQLADEVNRYLDSLYVAGPIMRTIGGA